MLIHFVRNGPAYLPELSAYAEFLSAQGHATRIHDASNSVPNDAQAVWWICGRVPRQEARRLRHAFQVHEYASASVPPHAWLKDQVKRVTQPRPDHRVFQNAWVHDRMGFADSVPFSLRDMGVAQAFLDMGQQHNLPAPEFDLVYLGEMTRLMHFLPVLHAIHAAGRHLLLIGDVPSDLRRQLPASVSCTGRVPYTDVPHQLRRARVGLNLVQNIAPYHQQTSTKLLEYCAVGLPVVSNDYPWARSFEQQQNARFLWLSDQPDRWADSLGSALDRHDFRVPDLHTHAWPRVLAGLPVWSALFNVNGGAA